MKVQILDSVLEKSSSVQKKNKVSNKYDELEQTKIDKLIDEVVNDLLL